MKKDINVLFQCAQNSENALRELTDVLMSYGKAVTKSLINRYSIYNITVDEVEDYILALVNDIITNYIPGRVSFKDYVMFVMYKRLTSKLIELCSKKVASVVSLDDCFDDDTPYYDIIEDKKCESIPESISYDEFHFSMSSPRLTDDPISIKKKKVYALEEQGYTGIEIIQLLKLSEGQYRYIKSLIKKDLELMKNKMDLK